MDYQEAIETHINECRHRIDVIRRHVNANGDADTNVCNKNIEVLEISISAMQELQAIHENGISLERLKDIDFRKQVVEHINYMEYMDIKDELEEFKQLGTLEEVREAVDTVRRYEAQYLDDMKNPLEPLKISSALKSEIMKLEFRKQRKPESISIFDYTIIAALQKVLKEVGGES